MCPRTPPGTPSVTEISGEAALWVSAHIVSGTVHLDASSTPSPRSRTGVFKPSSPYGSNLGEYHAQSMLTRRE